MRVHPVFPADPVLIRNDLLDQVRVTATVESSHTVAKHDATWTTSRLPSCGRNRIRVVSWRLGSADLVHLRSADRCLKVILHPLQFFEFLQHARGVHPAKRDRRTTATLAEVRLDKIGAQLLGEAGGQRDRQPPLERRRLLSMLIGTSLGRRTFQRLAWKRW